MPLSDHAEVTPQTMAAKVLQTHEKMNLLVTQTRCKVSHVSPQPARNQRFQQTLNVFIKVGDIVADVLLDSGSTTDMMTLYFAYITRVQCVELEVQMRLRLAV